MLVHEWLTAASRPLRVGLTAAMLLAAGVCVPAGCEKKDDKPSQPAQPPNPSTPAKPQARATDDTQPADAGADPATQPATTRPAKAASELTLDDGVTQRTVEFPPARIRVSKHGDTVTALLYSDDPKAAINDDYTGNSYYLEMPLEIREPVQIVSAEWHYRVDSNEYMDSPYGIFLQGMKVKLQPADVVVHFNGDMMFLRVQIEGKFLAYNTSNPGQVGQPVMIKGSLLAAVEMK
jgi:hypothetical protein